MSSYNDNERTSGHGGNQSGFGSSDRRTEDSSYASGGNAGGMTGGGMTGSGMGRDDTYSSSGRGGDMRDVSELPGGNDPHGRSEGLSGKTDPYSSSGRDTGVLGRDATASGGDTTAAGGYGRNTASGPGYGGSSGGVSGGMAEGIGEPTRSYPSGNEPYGTGATGGTGFDNKSSGYGADSGEYRGTGATGGAAFDNKSSGYGADSGEYRGTEGMGDHKNPYTGGHDSYGSGSTGGAGYGNKSSGGSHGDDNHGGKQDSTAGKLMEKVGGMLKNEGLERKGEEMRAKAGHDERSSH